MQNEEHDFEMRRIAVVGKPRRGVPARVLAGGTNHANELNNVQRCAAGRGADGASAPSLPSCIFDF